MPAPQKFDLSTHERLIRPIDVHAPIVLRDSDAKLRRLNKERLLIDSIHHNNNLIIAAQYARDIGRIITVDSYSDKFFLYRLDCTLDKKI